jgi:hypothetical protein
MTRCLLTILLLLSPLSHSREIQLICDGKSWINGVPAPTPLDRAVLTVVIHEEKEKSVWEDHPSYIATKKALRSLDHVQAFPGTGHFEMEWGEIYPFTWVSEREYQHQVMNNMGDKVRSMFVLDRFNLQFTAGRLVGNEYWSTDGVCYERGQPKL